jgi:hypothetical protein
MRTLGASRRLTSTHAAPRRLKPPHAASTSLLRHVDLPIDLLEERVELLGGISMAHRRGAGQGVRVTGIGLHRVAGAPTPAPSTSISSARARPHACASAPRPHSPSRPRPRPRPRSRPRPRPRPRSRWLAHLVIRLKLETIDDRLSSIFKPVEAYQRTRFPSDCEQDEQAEGYRRDVGGIWPTYLKWPFAHGRLRRTTASASASAWGLRHISAIRAISKANAGTVAELWTPQGNVGSMIDGVT